MKKLINYSIYLFFLQVLFNLNANAQVIDDVVGTFSSEDLDLFENQDLKSTTPAIKYGLCIYYRTESGNIQQSTSNDNIIMSNLATYYSGTDITFGLIESKNFTGNIPKPTSYNPYPTSGTRCLRLVIVKSISGFSGLAYTEAYTMYAEIQKDYIGTTTPAHEIGHLLRLPHTFQGTRYNYSGTKSSVHPNCYGTRGELYYDESGESCDLKVLGFPQIPENVTRNVSDPYYNADTAGDRITDTPADPDTWFANGTYDAQCTDADNKTYTPLSNNIMSYNGSYRSSFTDNQATIMRQFGLNNGRRFNYMDFNIPEEMDNGDTHTCSVTTTYPFETGDFVTWSITNISNSVSINSSTGHLVVNGTGSATETITYKLYTSPTNYTSYTKTIGINKTPSAPTTTLPYNTETNYYDAEPLDVDVLYKFIMTNCGSSSSNYDYEWTSDGASDFIFKDINGNVVSDGNTAYGKTAYIECFEDDEITLSARYRENSSSLWSDWYAQNLTFEAEEMMMMMAPNPISLSLESSSIIQLVSTNESIQINYDLGWEMEIYDVNFTKKVKQIVKKKEYELKTQGWKSGTYLVKAKYNNKTLTGKLLLQD